MKLYLYKSEFFLSFRVCVLCVYVCSHVCTHVYERMCIWRPQDDVGLQTPADIYSGPRGLNSGPLACPASSLTEQLSHLTAHKSVPYFLFFDLQKAILILTVYLKSLLILIL